MRCHRGRAVEVLERLARTTGRNEFAERAHIVLAAHASRVRTHSVDAAGYVLAHREFLLREPL